VSRGDRRERPRRARGAEVGLVLLVLGGCTVRGPLLEPGQLTGLPRRVELEQTPFFLQREYQCGPAALATLLAAGGVVVRPDDLVDEVYLPGRKGSLPAEMIAATRSRGQLPYLVPESLPDVLALVASGEPVLVLQKTGAGPWPGWHYAVVVGYDLDRERVLLRSGSESRLELPLDRFLLTWERAGHYALAALEPGAVPAPAEFSRYMAGAAGLEAVGQHEAAARAYAAAANRWPEQTLPHLGMANLAYARGDLAGAERLLAGLIQRAPQEVAARNNRALVLLEMGCPKAARQQLTATERLAVDGPFAASLAGTRRQIDAYGWPDGPACPHEVTAPLAQ
jgi:hypothetical protein